MEKNTLLEDFFKSEQIFLYRELSVSDLVIGNEAKYKRMEEEMGKAESAVIFLIPYGAGQKTTNLSVYAQPRDYHLYLRLLSQRFHQYLEERNDSLSFCAFTDSSPILERDAALKAGLGFLGENGLVLNKTYGSFFFIGEFFLSRALSPSPPVSVQTCFGCGACKKACPTDAISDPKRTRCLSLISQKKNRSPEEESLLASQACKWGCDLCQNVCPVNQNAGETPIPFFREDHISRLTPDVIDSPKEEFLTRAFSWRGREILRKNLKG